MELIDTHQHLILRERLGYAWTEGEPKLAGDFTPDDYACLVAGKGVVGTVFMETGVDDADYQAEARHVADLVGQGTSPMLGQIASCRPEQDDGFEAWLEECRDLNVVGFRRILQVMPDDTSRSDVYRRNIRRIGAAGWPVDLCFAAGQLDIAADLVRACPDTRFILDHCGTNNMRRGEIPAWRERMARLAALPNLWVKFSGMTAYVPSEGDARATVAPVAEAVLDLFGPERLIWGGDWPVVDLGVGLPGWIDMTLDFLSSLSEDEKDRVGSRNAREFYRLPAA